MRRADMKTPVGADQSESISAPAEGGSWGTNHPATPHTSSNYLLPNPPPTDSIWRPWGWGPVNAIHTSDGLTSLHNIWKSGLHLVGAES